MGVLDAGDRATAKICCKVDGKLETHENARKSRSEVQLSQSHAHVPAKLWEKSCVASEEIL